MACMDRAFFQLLCFRRSQNSHPTHCAAACLNRRLLARWRFVTFECNSRRQRVTLRWTRSSMFLPLSTLSTNEHQPTNPSHLALCHCVPSVPLPPSFSRAKHPARPVCLCRCCVYNQFYTQGRPHPSFFVLVEKFSETSLPDSVTGTPTAITGVPVAIDSAQHLGTT